MEVFRLRLLSAWSGSESPPRAMFPYVDKPIDFEAVKADALLMDQQLVSNGKGGYRWIDEVPPEVPRIGDRPPPN